MIPLRCASVGVPGLGQLESFEASVEKPDAVSTIPFAPSDAPNAANRLTFWALVRVDSNELLIKDRPIKAGNDQADHFIPFFSTVPEKPRVLELFDSGQERSQASL